MKRSESRKQSKELKFSRGKYYHIKNLFHNLYLTVEKSNQYEKQEIFLKSLENFGLSQLWMIEQVVEGTYQIVHAFSSFVMELVQNQVKLRQNKQKNCQTFWFERNINEIDQDEVNVFTIKQFKQSNKQLFYTQSQLRCQQQLVFVKNSNKWKIQLVQNHAMVQETCIIENCYTDLVLQVYNSSLKPGQRIIQNIFTNTLNQRWHILRNGQYFIIRSLVSQLVLDIKQEKTKQGTPVIQWQLKDSTTNNLNQKWILQQHGKRIFIIRSALDNNLMLGIEGNSLKDQQELIITKNQAQAFWRITGNFVP